MPYSGAPFGYQLTTKLPGHVRSDGGRRRGPLQRGSDEGKPIEAGLRYLERFRPSVSLRQSLNHYFYSHYYAIQAMWHAGGERWRLRYPDIRDELLHFQYHTSSEACGIPRRMETNTRRRWPS